MQKVGEALHFSLADLTSSVKISCLNFKCCGAKIDVQVSFYRVKQPDCFIIHQYTSHENNGPEYRCIQPPLTAAHETIEFPKEERPSRHR